MITTTPWWTPCKCSGVKNYGLAIDDTIGTYVEGLYTSFGWDTLTYYGSAPDIGAYEFLEAEEQADPWEDDDGDHDIDPGDLPGPKPWPRRDL